MDYYQQLLADIKARGKQDLADVKAWGDGLRAKYARENEQSNRDVMEKMQRDHDDDIERMEQDSQQRINDYRAQSFANIEQPTFEAQDVESESPGFDEPEHMEDDVASDLLDRMNARD